MVSLQRYMRSLFQLLAGLAFIAMPLAAGAGDVPMPDVPQAKARFSDAQGCVEPTEVMRKQHMEFILHQRDKTMREGIRTRQHALEECINCHVQPGADGKIARIDSKEHFCSSCHSYAAVSIDCFQCHADRPQADIQADHMKSGALPGQDMQGHNLHQPNQQTRSALQLFAAGDAQ